MKIFFEGFKLGFHISAFICAMFIIMGIVTGAFTAIPAILSGAGISLAFGSLTGLLCYLIEKY